jgi:hypothetical protein
MGKAPILTVVTELGSDEAYRNTQEDEHGFDHQAGDRPVGAFTIA